MSWAPTLDDKGIFYRFCAAAGLPIPEVYAIYFKTAPGYGLAGASLQDLQQWADFASTALPGEFLVKPCVSHGGSGVVGLTKTSGSEFASSLDRAMTE